MFHISDDARSRRSAAAVCRALEDLLPDEGLDRVTVSALVARAGIGRATFYRLFDTPADVASYQCELIVDQTVAAATAGFSPSSVTATSAVLLDGWMSHRTLLLALASAGRLDLLQQAHRARAGQVRELLKLPPDRADDARLMADIITALVPLAITDWIARGAEETAEELSIRVRSVLRLAAI